MCMFIPFFTASTEMATAEQAEIGVTYKTILCFFKAHRGLLRARERKEHACAPTSKEYKITKRIFLAHPPPHDLHQNVQQRKSSMFTDNSLYPFRSQWNLQIVKSIKNAYEFVFEIDLVRLFLPLADRSLSGSPARRGRGPLHTILNRALFDPLCSNEIPGP